MKNASSIIMESLSSNVWVSQSKVSNLEHLLKSTKK